MSNQSQAPRRKKRPPQPAKREKKRDQPEDTPRNPRIEKFQAQGKQASPSSGKKRPKKPTQKEPTGQAPVKKKRKKRLVQRIAPNYRPKSSVLASKKKEQLPVRPVKHHAKRKSVHRSKHVQVSTTSRGKSKNQVILMPNQKGPTSTAKNQRKFPRNDVPRKKAKPRRRNQQPKRNLAISY